MADVRIMYCNCARTKRIPPGPNGFPMATIWGKTMLDLRAIVHLYVFYDVFANKKWFASLISPPKRFFEELDNLLSKYRPDHKEIEPFLNCQEYVDIFISYLSEDEAKEFIDLFKKYEDYISSVPLDPFYYLRVLDL